MTLPRSSRRSFLRAAAGATALATAGCLQAATNATSDSRQRTFRMIGQPIRTLDPVASVDTASNRVITQLFDGLAHYPKGNPTPELLLADAIDVSADGTVYTVTLKEGVTFSNGASLRAADVVYSFERIAASPNSRWAGMLLDRLGVEHDTHTVTTDDGSEREAYLPGSLGVTALDDRTVELRLTAPFHAALDILALPAFAILPEGIVDDVPGYDGEHTQQAFAKESPVGAGPFTLGEWVEGTKYSVVARDDYHRDGPNVAGIQWEVISEPTSGFTYAMNENADAFWVPDAKFDRSKLTVDTVDDQGRKIGSYGPFEANGLTARYVQVPLVSTFYVGFNTGAVPKPVRQAVAYVFDQQTQVEDVHAGRGSPAVHVTPRAIFPGGPDAYDEHAERYPYGAAETRIEDAQAVMEAAGYGPDDRADLTFTTYTSAAWQSTAGLLRDKLAAAYVDLRVEQAPFPTLATRGERGTLEMFSYGWMMDYPSPQNFLQLLAPPTDGFYTFWDGTPAADRAREAWATIGAHQTVSEADAAARAEAYLAMEEANWEDVVVLPKFHPVGEGFYYPWVDLPPTGAAGFSKHKYTDVTIGSRE
ncbi:ABC transporter substrate-binding protein [Halobacteriaceae archaeon GCM10025711]